MSGRRTRHKSAAPVSGRKTATSGQATRGILELDRFTEVDLTRWNRLSTDLDRFHSLLHFGLAEQRNALRKELLEALRNAPSAPFAFKDWTRILPYRYCLSPLSATGSLGGIGGRFNVGRDISPEISPAWPALYLAEDFNTAFKERYGHARGEIVNSLAPEELALEKPGSFPNISVSGRIERPFDLTEPKVLKPFCDVLAKCTKPREAAETLHRLKVPQRNLTLVKTPSQLQKVVMAHDWRQWPMQFDLPAQSQVLASLLIAAGFEAVLYPSTKSDKRCLAVFPCNLGSKNTCIELAPGYPEQVDHCRLDMDSATALSGMSFRS